MKSWRAFLVCMNLVVAMLFSHATAFAKTAQREEPAENLACSHYECGSQVYYKVDDEVLTLYGEGAMCDFSIYRFMSEFESPWYWKDFDHIVIEPGITHIGNYAFAFCNPESITIPDTVTSIGKEAFYDCHLTEVIYNGTMAQWEQIDDNSCDGNLTQNPVNCTDGVYTCVVDGGEWTLSEGTLTLLENPTGGWFDPCLEDWPFSEIPWFTYRNFIDEVVIADGVTYICGGAFIWLDVERILIPESVTGFGYYSFYSYRADHIYYTGTEDQWNRISMDDCGFDYDVTPVYSCPHSEVNGSCIVCGKILQTNPCDTLGHSFTSYTNNGNGTITATCDRCDATTTVRGGNIDTKAWWKLENNTLTIFGTGEMQDYYGYETVPPWSGSGCTQVVIEEGITSICRYAFDGQEEIKSVSIPATVTQIGNYAFGGCTGVQEITYGGTIAQWKAVSLGKDDGALTQNPIQCTDGIYDPAAITGTCGENLTWTLSGKTLTISGTGPMEDFWYDPCFEDEPYVDSPWQQYSSQVTRLVIEEGVTSISEAAFFRFTEIRELTIPNSVTGIGIYAFRECGLTDVTLGSGMKFLWGYTFQNCSNLSRLTLGKNVADLDECLFEIGADMDIYLTGSIPVVTGSEYFFEGKKGTYTLHMTQEDLRQLCQRDFKERYDAASNLPGWVDTIYLDGTPMTQLVIPEGVTSVGSYVFANWVGITSVSIPSGVTNVGNGAFSGCENLETLTIAEGVRSLGDEAFKDCYKLKSVVIPDSVTYLGESAFCNCKALKQATIGSGITQINWLTFACCDSLSEVTIPVTVTRIDVEAFDSCDTLAEVYYGGNRADWDNVALEDGNADLLGATIHFTGHEHTYTFYLSNNDATCTQDGTKTAKCDHCNVLDTKVDVGSALGHSFTNYISNGNGTKTATCDRCDATDTLPDDGPKFGTCGENLQWELGADGILKISGTGAMTDFTYDFDTGATDIPWHGYRMSITAIEIESGITTIGKNAFRDLTGVTSVTIPEGVTTIGSSAFWLCTGLKTVEIPETVTQIGGYVFYKCSSLTAATVPTGVTTIQNSTFYQCGAMTNVTLPATITSIGDAAFRGCSALKDVYFGGDQTQWTSIILGGNNIPLTNATVHVVSLKDGWVEEEGNWYFYENGEKVTNAWREDSAGKCYLTADGTILKNGWAKEGEDWRYLNQQGYIVMSGWAKDSHGWCYLENGYMLYNAWREDSAHGWCYIDKQGYWVENGWAKDSVGWCYIENGFMVYNTWKKDSKGWCYIGSRGYQVVDGWAKDSVGWCYLGKDGYMVYNTWKADSKGWCYINKQGYLTTNNWAKDNKGWYWMDANGYISKQATRVIGGKTYNFDTTTGLCLNP